MASNNVVVTISAKDQLTGHLRGIRGQLSGMGSSLDEASAKVAGMGSAFIGLAAGVATTVFAVAGLGKGLKEAMNLELTSVSTAEVLMEKMGVTAGVAARTVKDLYKEISTLSAALPNSEQAYLAAANSAASFASRASKGDTKKFREITIDASTIFGLSGASTNTSAPETGEIVNRFLAGEESLKQLMRINSIQKDPRLTGAIRETLRDMGKSTKDWEKLQDDERVDFVKRLKAKYATPEYIARLSDTTDGYFQSIVARLFSPVNGLFGFMRDIPALVGTGTRTANDSVKNFLKSVMELTEVLSGKKGIDPMVLIANMFDGFTETIKDVKAIIEKGGDIWHHLTIAFTAKLTGGLEDLTKMIQSVDWSGLGTAVGSNITKILTDDQLGSALEKAITAGLQGIADTIIGAIKGSLKELAKDFDPTQIAAREAKGMQKIGSDLQNSPVIKDSIPLLKPIGDAAKGAFDFGNWLGQQFGGGGTNSAPLSSLPSIGSSQGVTKSQQMSNVININGAASNPQEIAAAVMSQINSAWQDRTNASLA